ncbi:MAG: UDP-N-acetylmuramate dehydrogenase [Candidatus Paceibacterota bacterium]
MSKPKFSGFEVREGVELGPYTTFGIGGPAEYFVEAGSSQELLSVVSQAKAIALKTVVLSGGSNVVISDKGVSGLVVKILSPKREELAVRGFVKQRGLSLDCDGSVLLLDLVNFCVDGGLAGVESLAGIPGTLAGALVGNAGAYGHSISEVVKRVQIYDGEKSRWMSKKDCAFSYRDSSLKNSGFCILRAELALQNPSTDIGKIRDDIIATRNKKYPKGLKCPGSFFKNIVAKSLKKEVLEKIDPAKIIEGKVPAGYLLQEAGGQGQFVGGVAVSDFHCNVLLNNGGATFDDVVSLSQKLKALVKEKFGIDLDEEVRYIA